MIILAETWDKDNIYLQTFQYNHSAKSDDLTINQCIKNRLPQYRGKRFFLMAHFR